MEAEESPATEELTAEDVREIEALGRLEYDQASFDDSDYRWRLAQFDIFRFQLALLNDGPSGAFLQYREKLRDIDTTQDAASLGMALVNAFGLTKPETRLKEDNFYRDTDIAHDRIVRKVSVNNLAERHGLEPRSISRIVKKYRAYIEASEKHFPTEK